MHKYIVIVDKTTLNLLRTDDLSDDPCKYFPKYKARRFSTCRCRPCFDKYVENQKRLGKTVTEMPDGWKPY